MDGEDAFLKGRSLVRKAEFHRKLKGLKTSECSGESTSLPQVPRSLKSPPVPRVLLLTRQ